MKFTGRFCETATNTGIQKMLLQFSKHVAKYRHVTKIADLHTHYVSCGNIVSY